MSRCPICRRKDCIERGNRHLLACFDLTFPGQGDLGAGLGSGALYDHPNLSDLLAAIQRDRLAAWGSGGQAAPASGWIRNHPHLRAYFASLGTAGFTPRPGEGPDEALSRLRTSTADHASSVRELLDGLCRDAGWEELVSRDEDSAFLASSAYQLWWDRHPAAVAKTLQETIADLPLKAARTPARRRQRTGQADAATPSTSTSGDTSLPTPPVSPACDAPCTPVWLGTEPPGAREAFDHLRVAASDPTILRTEFNALAGRFFREGFAPDQWVTPSGEAHSHADVRLAISRYGWGQVRGLLNDGTPIPREPSELDEEEEEDE